MHEQHDANERWQRLIEIHESVDVALPELVSRLDGRPREGSQKGVAFARALAVSDGWSGISEARRRYGDLAA